MLFSYKNDFMLLMLFILFKTKRHVSVNNNYLSKKDHCFHNGLMDVEILSKSPE